MRPARQLAADLQVVAQLHRVALFLVLMSAWPNALRAGRPRTKTTRGGVIGFRDRSRRLPIADRVLPLIRACAEGRGPDERLFVTESGHRLHATAFKRTLNWAKMSEGRRFTISGTRQPACGSVAGSMW